MPRISLLTLFHVYASPFRVPIVFDEFGEAYVDGRVVGLYGPDVILRFRLSTYLTSSNRRPLSDTSLRVESEVVSLINPTTFTEITGYFENRFFIGSRDAWNRSTVISTMRIGSRSAIASAYDSIDFVNVLGPVHSGFLELGNPYETFSGDFCRPETVFNVTVDRREYARGYIRGTFGDSMSSNIAFMRSSVSVGVGGGTRGRIEVPDETYDHIISIVRRESDGLFPEPLDGESNFVFESCERVRRAIGPIIITFVDHENPTSVQGSIVFKPTDFMHVVANDTCELLITRPSNDEYSISVDVLIMKNVNIRFTLDQITFCDTSL